MGKEGLREDAENNFRRVWKSGLLERSYRPPVRTPNYFLGSSHTIRKLCVKFQILFFQKNILCEHLFFEISRFIP